MKFLTLCKILAVVLPAFLLALPDASYAIAKKGQPAPAFQLVTTSGQKVSLAGYNGSVLVIEFFATWCGGCKDSLPHLTSLQKQFGGQGLQILALNIGQGDSPEQVKSFVAARKIGFPVAMADEDLIYDGFGIRMVPTIFIINKKGVVVEKFSGFNNDVKKIMETTIKKLVAE